MNSAVQTLAEKTEQAFEQLKNCPDSDIGKQFDSIFITYPLLKNEERTILANSFNNWAKANITSQPLKNCYANYFIATNDFFAEKYETAVSLGAQTQQQFAELNNKDGVALCSSMLGGTYRTLGNVDLALKTLWEAYEHLKTSAFFKHNLMVSSFQIASIYAEMKNDTEAELLFKSTYETAEKLQNNTWMMHSLNGLGKVYLLQKKYPQAIEFHERALAIAEKINAPIHISICLTELANYYFETSNYTESEQLHLKALSIREQHKFIGGAITNLLGLSEIYLKQNKPDEAIQMLEKGLKFAAELKVKPKTFQIHLLLSKAYELKQDLPKSIYHYKLYHQIQEEVEKEDAAKKIKNIQLIFEAEQTKKENVIIKKQKKEIEEKNVELQETIDELTITKISKKAKIITMVIAIVLFIAEEIIHHSVLHMMHDHDFVMSLVVKGIIVISLKPIDSAVEHFLLKKIIKKKLKTA